MAILSLRDFPTLVQTQAAAVQSSCRSLVDFSVGSVLRAIAEANASVALWMQWLTLLVLQTTRAATSNGSDLDTWVADYSLSRLPGIPATGLVTFTRFTPGQTALVPLGATVKTLDGTQQFAVTEDDSNSAWNATLGGYLVPAAVSGIAVPVQSVNPGVQGNVQAGTIALLTSAIPGVDQVSNAAPFTNGIDAESDAALRNRFALYIQTRSLATAAAVGAAISSVQQGLTWTIAENVTPSGGALNGYFTVTVDDGSGAPSASLLATVYSAIDQVRPLGVAFAVQPPQLLLANIALTIQIAAGYNRINMLGPIQTALASFVNALPTGRALPLSRLTQIAYDATPGIVNVTSVTINGVAADLGGGPSQSVRAGTIVVS